MFALAMTVVSGFSRTFFKPADLRDMRMVQWAAAGIALDDVRARDLRLLSEGEALQPIEDLLSTAEPNEYPAVTWALTIETSGLSSTAMP